MLCDSRRRRTAGVTGVPLVSPPVEVPFRVADAGRKRLCYFHDPEGVLYTNWARLPVVGPLTKGVLSATLGAEYAETLSLRSYFLNTYRVISDSYGVFVYDPEAGYARGFAPSYNFRFHGWRNGVMVM